MYIYLIFELLLIFSIFLFKNEKKISFFLILLLVLLSSFRSVSVGADMEAYEKNFVEISNQNFTNVVLGNYPLFGIFAKICSLIDNNFRFFIIACSILVGILVYIIVVNSETPLMTLFVFYSLGLYLQSFCIIRQSLAILFILIGFLFLKKGGIKNVLLYYLFNIIAIGFHVVSIIMLVVPVIYLIFYKVKPSIIKYVVFGLIGAFIIFLIYRYFYNQILSLVYDKYTYLYGVDGKRTFNGNYLGGLLYSALYIIIFVLFIVTFDKLSLYEKKIYGIIFIVAFSFNVLSYISEELGRFNLFTESILAIFASNIISKYYKKNDLIYFVYSLFFITYFVLYLYRDSIQIVPYAFL